MAQQVEEVVMESTAQYWKPVWGTLERYWKPICQKREGAGPMSGTLHLAQAQSNRGRRGRKKDAASGNETSGAVSERVPADGLRRESGELTPDTTTRPDEALDDPIEPPPVKKFPIN
jgi:hypothetical protein